MRDVMQALNAHTDPGCSVTVASWHGDAMTLSIYKQDEEGTLTVGGVQLVSMPRSFEVAHFAWTKIGNLVPESVDLARLSAFLEVADENDGVLLFDATPDTYFIVCESASYAGSTQGPVSS